MLPSSHDPTPPPDGVDAAVRAIRVALVKPLPFVAEDELHAAIGLAFAAAGIAFEHEVDTPQGRLDFRVGSIPIEVKVGGSRAALLRQIDRYASGDAPCVVVVTSLRRLALQLPATIHEKPVHAILVRRAGGTL